jgi:iduronate 2-sulfatase
MSVFEESARVPLIIAAPGTSVEGGVAKDPVGHIDLYPTLAELCGVEAPKNLQGQSLVPMLSDPSVTGRGWAITQVSRRRSQKQGGRFFGYSLRTPRWRYTEWEQGKQGRELYDHDADPRELTNLAGNAAYGQTIAKLSGQLRQAIRQTFPASGKTPALRPALWAPNLTNP